MMKKSSSILVGVALIFSSFAPSFALKIEAQISPKEFDTDQIIVKFKESDRVDKSTDIAKKHNIDQKSKLKSQNLGVYKVKFGNVNQKLLDELKANPAVEYAEPDFKIKTNAAIDSEPMGSQQWGMENATTDKDIDINEAWTKTMGSPDVVVAVIDTGIDYTHPDLVDRLCVNPDEIPGNGLDDDNNGIIDDVNGYNAITETGDIMDDNSHGTRVSGVIAASYNTIGVAGVAPNIKIMPLKSFNSSGQAYISDSIQCIEYAKSKGVKIINASWGSFNSYNQTLRDAIQNSGALFIAAAGNYNWSNDTDGIVYPASYDCPNIISVAAVDNNGEMATFTNWGKISVDLAAPGVNVLSTNLGGGYTSSSGTSFATPFVSGTAALLMSVGVTDPIKIKEVILKTVKPVISYGLMVTDGMVDAGNAIDFINNIVRVTGVSLSQTNLSMNKGSTFQLTATVLPTNATNKGVKFTSSNSAVATVNSTGLVSAISNGTAVITVKTDDGGYTSTCNLTVNDPSIDTTAPTVVSTTPASGASGVLANTVIKINFNENIQASIMISNISLAKVVKGVRYQVATNISINGNVITITPATNLSSRTSYTVTLPAKAVKDIAGNECIGYSFSFKTK